MKATAALGAKLKSVCLCEPVKPPLGESGGACDSYFSASWVPNLSSVLLGGRQAQDAQRPTESRREGDTREAVAACPPAERGLAGSQSRPQGTNTFLKLAALTGCWCEPTELLPGPETAARAPRLQGPLMGP